MGNADVIRFAPIIRVSTEQQKSQGQSLETQKNQILQYVQTLDGTIPDNCWKYSGQEHATPGQERKKLDMLLADTLKNIFDAVIVCDVSRWSRDNAKSKAGLEVLRKNGIRFYVGISEYDLYDPQARMFLGMSTEMNEFFALEQNRKSILNRIERAKKGWPTGGKLPYGRTFDKATKKWGIDKKKKDRIRVIAEQYLNGVSMSQLSKTYGMNHPNLWKILTKRCGKTWELKFKSDKLNIDEVIEIKIPPLLPKSLIDKIHKRAEANKTYTHGHIKNKYLLSRVIFCEHCGYAMFGQTNHGKRRYYRHARGRKKMCATRNGLWVNANAIEEAVILYLFNMYGDEEYLKRAMQQAIPNGKKIAKLIKERSELVVQNKQVESQKQRIVKAIGEGVISSEDAEKNMKSNREQEELINKRIEQIDSELENVPTEDQINERAKKLRQMYGDYSNLPEHLSEMSYDDLRLMVQSAFSGNGAGKDHKGNRLGVYVKRLGRLSKNIIFTIKGELPDELIMGDLPLTKEDYIDLICWPENDFNFGEKPNDGKGQLKNCDEEINKFKLNMRGKRDAHHRLGLYQ